MPKSSGSMARRLETLVSEIEAAAYERGRADARKELLNVLAAGGERRGRGSRGKRAEKPAPAKRRARERKRAPRGSVPRFVERVLRERPGSTVQEIVAFASTYAERSMKLASIRTDLQNGWRQGRYAVNDRRWSLVASDPAPVTGGQGTSSEMSPSSEPRPVESRSEPGSIR